MLIGVVSLVIWCVKIELADWLLAVGDLLIFLHDPGVSCFFFRLVWSG